MVPASMKKDCEKKIVRAHTISKSWNLQKISDKSFVYGLKFDLITLRDNCGSITVEKIGIGQASTFNGFCKYHDRILFSSIENYPFTDTEEQYFKLAYRIIAKELYLKKASNIIANELLPDLDKGENVERQMLLQRNAQQFKEGDNLANRDLEEAKILYDKYLEINDFSKIRYLTIEFEGTPDIMAAASIFPEYTFDGNLLQDLDDKSKNLDTIVFTTFTRENSWAFSFIWLSEFDKICIPFTQSLVDNIKSERIGNALVRFLFEYCENMYFSPLWWDNLSGNLQEELKCRFQTTLISGYNPDNLLENNQNYVNWNFTKIYKNYEVT